MIGHGGAEMRVLVEAARTAGKQFEAGTVLKGAATHTGASLLTTLRDMGWVLAPADAVGTWEAEFDTEGRVYPHSYERGPDLVVEVETPVWEYRVTYAEGRHPDMRRSYSFTFRSDDPMWIREFGSAETLAQITAEEQRAAGRLGVRVERRRVAEWEPVERNFVVQVVPE